MNNIFDFVEFVNDCIDKGISQELDRTHGFDIKNSSANNSRTITIVLTDGRVFNVVVSEAPRYEV